MINSLPSPPCRSRNQSWNWLVGWFVCQADLASQSNITKLLDNKKTLMIIDAWQKENLCLSSPDSSGSTVHPMWGILLSKRNHCQAGFHDAYTVCTLQCIIILHASYSSSHHNHHMVLWFHCQGGICTTRPPQHITNTILDKKYSTSPLLPSGELGFNFLFEPTAGSILACKVENASILGRIAMISMISRHQIA